MHNSSDMFCKSATFSVELELRRREDEYRFTSKCLVNAFMISPFAFYN